MATSCAIWLPLCMSLFISVNAYHPCSGLVGKSLRGEELTAASDQEFDLQQLLLAGFRRNEVNAYNIRRFGFTSNGGTERCIIVRYIIQCNDTNEICTHDLLSNRCEFEGEKNITEWAFLWSSFDTWTDVGKILLELAIFDLRVFGFELCDVYQDPVDVIIILNSSDPRIATTFCDSICNVLLDFTTLVSILIMYYYQLAQLVHFIIIKLLYRHHSI